MKTWRIEVDARVRQTVLYFIKAETEAEARKLWEDGCSDGQEVLEEDTDSEDIRRVSEETGPD